MFLYKNIELQDKLVQSLINEELNRQQNSIQLIASENMVSQDVLKCCGSILTHRYAEGKPPVECDSAGWVDIIFTDKEYKSQRYYNGCEIIDKIETLACNRFKTLFETDYHVNVQPHSGAQANMAVMEALLKEGDTILSMDLSNGGHLSHGSPVNYSGKHFNVIQYGINENGEIDYDEVERLALKHNPKLIICGASNYSKIIDFERFAQIRDKVNERRLQIIAKMENMTLAELNAVSYEDKYKNLDRECYLLADIAHIAGLIAAGVHPSPFGYVDVVTTTTHKSLRGPRGGVIACKPELTKKIDSAVFPGCQGGPLEHIIAAKAICFGEALLPEFEEYGKQVIKNAKTLCEYLMKYGFDIVGGMTENHLMTLDLRKDKITGKDFANELDKIGITANKNTVPNDPQSPFITSGVRLGVCAVTTRGFKEQDMKDIAYIMSELKNSMLTMDRQSNNYQLKLIDLKARSRHICEKYPLQYKEI